MADHARLSPSAASRWLTCTAAPMLEAEFPNESSVYAEEGTLAHELAELETGFALGSITKAVHTRRGNKISKHELYSAEMLDHALDYATYIKELFLETQKTCGDTFVELEVKLDLTDFVPGGFGTADCIIVADEVLNVIDFKYGKGVKVSAEDNSQMKLYALGAYVKYSMLYDIKTVNMTIIQPRLNSIETAGITALELLSWGAEVVKPKAEAAYYGNGTEFCPSESACRFCRAAGSCRARAEMFIELFEDNPKPELLDAEEAGAVLTKAKAMKAWLSALEENVFSAIARGVVVSNWKIVEGRSNRKYTDEDAVAEVLLLEGLDPETIYTKKLITISAVEKLMGKKKAAEVLGELVIKPVGTPVLAEINDKRTALNLTEEIVKAFDEE